MKDQSMLNPSSGANTGKRFNEYANELILEVCLNGDSFTKYQRQIEKQFGHDFYENCDLFVDEVNQSIKKKKFSNSSVINLKYLAKEINIPVETVDIITKHFKEQFEEEHRRFKETERKRIEKENKRAEAERKRAEEAERYRIEKEKKERQKDIAIKIAKWVGIIAALVAVGVGIMLWWKYILIGAIIIGIILYLLDRME